LHESNAAQSPHTQWAALKGSESALSGAGAGIVSAIVTCPLDLVKTKLQAEGALGGDSPRYKGLIGELLLCSTVKALTAVFKAR
jgi:hypothetical protein